MSDCVAPPHFAHRARNGYDAPDRAKPNPACRATVQSPVGHDGGVITTILAVYGSVVATGSLVLTAWIHIASGPKIQAQAELCPPLSKDEDDGWSLELHVWNAGRQS